MFASVAVILISLRFCQQNNEVMPVKNAAMALANLSGNQALLASNISSPETNLLCMKSNRQIIKCKPVFFLFFVYLEMKQPFFHTASYHFAWIIRLSE